MDDRVVSTVTVHQRTDYALGDKILRDGGWVGKVQRNGVDFRVVIAKQLILIIRRNKKDIVYVQRSSAAADLQIHGAGLQSAEDSLVMHVLITRNGHFSAYYTERGIGRGCCFL